MGLWRKLDRWPWYHAHSEVLEMTGKEYASWMRARKKERRQMEKETRHDARERKRLERANRTPEERAGRKRAILYVIGRMALGALKAVAIVVGAFIWAIFDLAKDQSSSRRR